MMQRGVFRSCRLLLALPEGPDTVRRFSPSESRFRPEADSATLEEDRPQAWVKDKARIGWVGLGEMGMGMAWKLAKDPQNSLHVWTRSERKLRAYGKMLEEKLNRHVFERPILLDVPRFADIIFVSLANIKAVREVLLERDDALLFNARAGSVVVDHSTVDLETSAECARIAAARGLHYLDAPLVGSPELAGSGNLTCVVGGDRAAFARVVKHINGYAHAAEWMGPSGSGCRAKMVLEQSCALHAAAAAETAMLARALEVPDLDALIRAGDASLGGSNMMRRSGGYWPLQFTSRTKVATGMTVSRVVRNMTLVERFVRTADLEKAKNTPGLSEEAPGALERSLPLTAAARDAFRRCGDAGGHDADVTSVVHFLDPESRGDSIMPVEWSVPVADELRTEQARRRAERADLEEELQHASDMSQVTEFDTPGQDDTLATSAQAPRMDPSRLYGRYSRVQPRAASGGAHVTRGGGWDPADVELANIRDKYQQRTLERFSHQDKRMGRVLGKTSFAGSDFHQRAPRLIDPFKPGVVPAANGPGDGSQ
eukprot:Hpha_TRINITY_DN27483_c0_g1::TRINITY_DN27483_c0_g1_i1::g.193857::m.193857